MLDRAPLYFSFGVEPSYRQNNNQTIFIQ